MDISDAVNLVKSLDPKSREEANDVVNGLMPLSDTIQDKLKEIGLKFELEVRFGNQWLYGMDYWDYDEDYDDYGIHRGEWVSSSSFSC